MEQAPTRENVLQKLRAHQQELKDLGVRNLSLFGSVARNDAGPRSDIDLLVEFEGPANFDDYFSLLELLESLLDCRVDLVTKAGLRQELRESVNDEALRVA